AKWQSRDARFDSPRVAAMSKRVPTEAIATGARHGLHTRIAIGSVMDVGALAVAVEDHDQFGRAVDGSEGVRRHGGELGGFARLNPKRQRLAAPTQAGPLLLLDLIGLHTPLGILANPARRNAVLCRPPYHRGHE